MKNHLFTMSVLLILAITYTSCKDADDIEMNQPSTPDYYAYYTTKAGYEWKYKVFDFDPEKNILYISGGRANYNDTLKRVDFYHDGLLESWTYWTNLNNTLGCCNGRILLNYDLLNCTSDSILIDQKEGGTSIETYQYCGDFYSPMARDYEDTKCIKTFQRNISSNGETLEITRYFAYNIGLIEESQLLYDPNGELQSIHRIALTSHNF